MSKRQNGLALSMCLSCALAALACDVRVGDDGLSIDVAHGRAFDEWTRSYAISQGGRIEIINLTGAIRASPGTGSAVEVHASLEARGGSDEAARQLIEAVDIGEEVSPDRVRVEVRGDRRGRLAGSGGPQLTIAYDVRVPSGVSAVFQTENGDVRVEGLTGHVTASSTNGRIVGRALSGSADASTVNGGIDLDFSAVAADTSLTTVNGGIRLAVSPGLDATVDLSVINGGISVDEGLLLTTDTRSRQRVRGVLNRGGVGIVAQATNGRVRLTSRDDGNTGGTPD